jgi:deazaflavin-dependent oxidoreductase (nitroreductase family)
MGGQPVLLLETTGRRSGRTRTTPVQYAARGDDFVVVAANHGARHHPAWYLNLHDSALGRVRVGEQDFDVAAREAAGDERTALWRELSAANRYLPNLQTKARRQLPLLLLTPAISKEKT